MTEIQNSKFLFGSLGFVICDLFVICLPAIFPAGPCELEFKKFPIEKERPQDLWNPAYEYC